MVKYPKTLHEGGKLLGVEGVDQMETSCWLRSQHELPDGKGWPGHQKWDEDSMEAAISAGIIRGNGEERAALVWDSAQTQQRQLWAGRGWGGDAVLV